MSSNKGNTVYLVQSRLGRIEVRTRWTTTKAYSSMDKAKESIVDTCKSMKWELTQPSPLVNEYHLGDQKLARYRVIEKEIE
jgi:hypothetical protein